MVHEADVHTLHQAVQSLEAHLHTVHHAVPLIPTQYLEPRTLCQQENQRGH